MADSSDSGSVTQSRFFNSAPRILVADDDPGLRILIRHVLQQCNYQVIEAVNGLEAVQHAIECSPDIIIMDAVMPEMDGFRATEEILKLDNCRETPVLVATSLDDDASVNKAFEAGASDYITKPINWSVLKHRIQRMIETVHAQRKIQHIAYHDSLTGLPNRVLFTDRIDQAITRAQRECSSFALLYIDIDHFKVVNDSMGHAAGDELLNIISKRLRDILRKSDTISRLGGDEFTVIIESFEDISNITVVARNILDALSTPVEVNQKSVYVGASIGVAIYPQDGKSFGSLLKNADTAMYRAKESGRNMFQFYAEEMSEKAMLRLELENQLHHALLENQLAMFYQPKIELATGKCHGMEALLRWQHPEKGLISPCEFIPVAEETGLVTLLDQWALKTSCRQFRRWLDHGLELDNLSVNISARHLNEGGLVDYCREIIQDSGVPMEKIEIELTESALVSNYSCAKKTLNQLHELGIRIALDDFGTGYASMSYLKEFPFDTVKLDRSFVKGVPGDEENTAIVRAMIQLAVALKLDIVAEGVEHLQQQEYLIGTECTYGQGFLWSQPLCVDDFEKAFLL